MTQPRLLKLLATAALLTGLVGPGLAAADGSRCDREVRRSAYWDAPTHQHRPAQWRHHPEAHRAWRHEDGYHHHRPRHPRHHPAPRIQLGDGVTLVLHGWVR